MFKESIIQLPARLLIDIYLLTYRFRISNVSPIFGSGYLEGLLATGSLHQLFVSILRSTSLLHTEVFAEFKRR